MKSTPTLHPVLAAFVTLPLLLPVAAPGQTAEQKELLKTSEGPILVW